MIVFLLLILVLIVTDMAIAPQGAYCEDYMSRDSNNVIKGVFILLIVLSHYSQYCQLDGAADLAYWAVRLHLDQAVVSMFLFYSGYGMMESIRRKGFAYVKRIPVHRLLKVWWNFVIAVLCFLILDIVLGRFFPAKHILLAFIGYTSLGNSDWYMFAIFSLYGLTFVAFLAVCRKNNGLTRLAGIALLAALTCGAILWQMKMDRPAWAYNTMLLYPLGALFSECRPLLESLLKKGALWYSGAALLTAIVYMYSYLHRQDRFLVFAVWVSAFTVAVLLLTWKVSFKSWVLRWFGENLFWVYILQRLPMTVLDAAGMVDRHRYFCLVLVILSTVLLTELFNRTVGQWNNRLFKRIEK